MKTITISGYGLKLSFRKGLFVISKNGEKVQEFSPLEIEQIIITTSGIAITSKAVRVASRLGIDIVFLDHKGEVIARLQPSWTSRTIETKRMQYLTFMNERGFKIAKWVILSKLSNQNEVIKYLAKSKRQSLIHDKLKILTEEHEKYIYELNSLSAFEINDKTRQEIMIIEANAARKYWEAIKLILPSELNFQGRNPESNDIVNLTLNYGYGLLKNTCFKALMIMNLDPYAGYLHIDRSGRPSLVLDVMEIFRPIVIDRYFIMYLSRNYEYVLKMIENGRLKPEYRAELVKLFNETLQKRIKYQDEYITYETLIYRTVKQLVHYIRDNGILDIVKVKIT